MRNLTGSLFNCFRRQTNCNVVNEGATILFLLPLKFVWQNLRTYVFEINAGHGYDRSMTHIPTLKNA